MKRFGPVVANGGIDFDVHAGESHALLGENGAGKSTLVKMLYGLLEPTEGTIIWQGRPVRLASPDAARALGIGMVFQHFSLFENLTVAENIGLVLPPQSPQSLAQRIVGLAGLYGLKLEPSRQVWTLSAGERQRIEIARCLLQDPRLIILDEPTSVLTPQEAETLFATLDRLKHEGRALLYISHRLEEVKRLCDRATILRGGKVIATCDPRQESARSIAAMMVGMQIGEVKPAGHEAGAVRFAAAGLSVAAADLHGTNLRRIGFEVRAGEILGIAGVAGNGQDEFFAALSGETLSDEAAQIVIDGQSVGRLGITARRLLNAAFVPEERNGHAAVPNLPLSDNTLLSRHATGGLDRSGFVLIDAAKALTRTIIKAFDVRVGGPDPAARTLSGGNLQKFLVGREILREPAVLVINQPTWGVDAAAAAAIHQSILDLAGRGAAILVISQDLDELFAISDRLAVIHAGELSDAIPVAETNRGEIGLLMTGSGPAAGPAHAH